MTTPVGEPREPAYTGPPAWINPQQYGPQQYGPQQYGPQQYGPQQYGPQQYGPQQYGPQQYGPQQYGPQQYWPQPAQPGRFLGYAQDQPPYPLMAAPGHRPRRLATAQVGWMLAVAGVLIVIGSLNTWVTFVFSAQSLAYAGTNGNRDGRVTLVLGVALAVLGLLISCRQGRLWVGVTAIVVATITALIGLADIGDVSDRSAQLDGLGRYEVGWGLVLVLVAGLFALGAGIFATAHRPLR